MEDTEERIDEGKIQGAKEPVLLEKSDLEKMGNYICKLKGNELTGTGFFCKIEYNNKLIPVLMTNYHVINDEFFDDNKSIIAYIKEKAHIINISKDSKIYSSPKNKFDIMIIKINEQSGINNYLEIDPNIFEKNSLSFYKKEDIYILHFPNSGDAYVSFGEGIEKSNEYDIKHLCNTSNGSSGGPILSSLTNKVIGIHKGYIKKGFNIGTFLKFPLDELKGNNEYNYIIAEIEIKDKNINKDIRIINSYEEFMRKLFPNSKLEEEYMNEKEINKCQIKINDELIPFNYFHKFKSKGNYTIKYSFMNYLTNTNYMFSDCSSLKNINLSNFNTQNVTIMSSMFSYCSSLENINLSNFNTQNVTNMGRMFWGCSSLKNINLSNFNTQNVTNMGGMFWGCSSLENINLSNFNTQNVTNISAMFSFCSSLRKENVITNDKRILELLEKI